MEPLTSDLACDVVTFECDVLDKRESAGKPERGIVHIETRAFNQNAERILVILAPKQSWNP